MKIFRTKIASVRVRKERSRTGISCSDVLIRENGKLVYADFAWTRFTSNHYSARHHEPLVTWKEYRRTA